DPGARLSLVVWSNLMRFLSGDGLPVNSVAAQAMAPENRVKFELGCLERWRFVVLEANSSDDRPVPTRAYRQAGRILRAGWGSGRGIRSNWVVRLTGRGRTACGIWPPLSGEIEHRWKTRFGDEEIVCLRQSLETVVGQLDFQLPE